VKTLRRAGSRRATGPLHAQRRPRDPAELGATRRGARVGKSAGAVVRTRTGRARRRRRVRVARRRRAVLCGSAYERTAAAVRPAARHVDAGGASGHAASDERRSTRARCAGAVFAFLTGGARGRVAACAVVRVRLEVETGTVAERESRQTRRLSGVTERVVRERRAGASSAVIGIGRRVDADAAAIDEPARTRPAQLLRHVSAGVNARIGAGFGSVDRSFEGAVQREQVDVRRPAPRERPTPRDQADRSVSSRHVRLRRRAATTSASPGYNPTHASTPLAPDGLAEAIGWPSPSFTLPTFTSSPSESIMQLPSTIP
jgi:hypothetical protein